MSPCQNIFDVEFRGASLARKLSGHRFSVSELSRVAKSGSFARCSRLVTDQEDHQKLAR